MKVPPPAVIIAVAVALGAPSLAAAQKPVQSFDQLNTRVSVGDTVKVTDVVGREVKGRITDLHDASVVLDYNGETVLRSDTVRLVQRRTKPVGHAALMGLGIGAAAGAVLGAIASAGECTSDCTGGEWAAGLGLGAGIGAGVGAAVRAALPASWREVYRAPGSSGQARLSVAPVITPHAKGVVVGLSF